MKIKRVTENFKYNNDKYKNLKIIILKITIKM